MQVLGWPDRHKAYLALRATLHALRDRLTLEEVAQLAAYVNRPDVLVLALPRGGVPIAYEVACALNVPPDVFLVCKLGVPGYEELAMGAMATGGVRVLNDHAMGVLRISDYVIDAAATWEQQGLARREHLYRCERLHPDMRGRTVILVDDGLLRPSGTERVAGSHRPKRVCTRRQHLKERQAMPSTTDVTLMEAVRQTAHPLPGAAHNYAPLMDLVGTAHFVLLGEASHGTHEFYPEVRVRFGAGRALGVTPVSRSASALTGSHEMKGEVPWHTGTRWMGCPLEPKPGFGSAHSPRGWHPCWRDTHGRALFREQVCSP